MARNSPIVEWEFVPFAEGWEDIEPDVVVWVSVPLLDEAWKLSGQWIGQGGIGSQDNRYERFGQWFRRGLPIHMCHAALGANGMRFGNGRHRFAWLRDHGLNCLPLQIAPEKLEIFNAQFGTDDRDSFVAVT